MRKYKNSIADAVAELGQPEKIGQFFAEFQKSFIATMSPNRKPATLPR